MRAGGGDRQERQCHRRVAAMNRERGGARSLGGALGGRFWPESGLGRPRGQALEPGVTRRHRVVRGQSGWRPRGWGRALAGRRVTGPREKEASDGRGKAALSSRGELRMHCAPRPVSRVPWAEQRPSRLSSSRRLGSVGRRGALSSMSRLGAIRARKPEPRAGRDSDRLGVELHRRKTTGDQLGPDRGSQLLQGIQAQSGLSTSTRTHRGFG